MPCTIITIILCACLFLFPHSLLAERYILKFSDLALLNEFASQCPEHKVIEGLKRLVVDLPAPPEKGIPGLISWEKDAQGRFEGDEQGDPLSPDQWYLNTLQVWEVWQESQGGDVLVALIDSGVDYNHPDLAEQVVLENAFDFGDQDTDPIDENGHGTAMAGLIAAARDGQGIVGVAPKAVIVPLKINSGGLGAFNTSDVAQAVIYAADIGVDIINLSIVIDEDSETLMEALDCALAKGIHVVAAAGNGGEGQVSFPASYPGVIAVSATNQSDNRYSGSNFGSQLTVSAPGVSLLSTCLGGDWAHLSGSSTATALVSGVLALELAAGSVRPVADLVKGSIDLGEPGYDISFGYGLVSARGALDAVRSEGLFVFPEQMALAPGDKSRVFFCCEALEDYSLISGGETVKVSCNAEFPWALDIEGISVGDAVLELDFGDYRKTLHISTAQSPEPLIQAAFFPYAPKKGSASAFLNTQNIQGRPFDMLIKFTFPLNSRNMSEHYMLYALYRALWHYDFGYYNSSIGPLTFYEDSEALPLFGPVSLLGNLSVEGLPPALYELAVAFDCEDFSVRTRTFLEIEN